MILGQTYFWADTVQKRINDTEKDIEAGRYKDYETASELLKDLHGEEKTVDSSLRSE